MVRWVCCTTLLVTSISATVRASVFSIPLDQLKGVHVTDADWQAVSGPVYERFSIFQKTFSVDVGRDFARIDSLHLSLRGTARPGLWDVSYMNADMIGPLQIERYPVLHLQLGTGGSDGNWALGSLTPAGDFDADVPLGQLILRDGWAGKMDFTFYLTGPMSLGAATYRQVAPAVVEIADASLTIDGVQVPEPASACAGLVAAAILLRRNRRHPT